MKPIHGNSHQNNKTHHLYEVFDTEEEKVYKYGISDKPIGEDGLSSRLRDQLALFNNVVGWLRFVGQIILTGIIGRKKAEEIEDEHILEYKKNTDINLVAIENKNYFYLKKIRTLHLFFLNLT